MFFPQNRWNSKFIINPLLDLFHRLSFSILIGVRKISASGTLIFMVLWWFFVSTLAPARGQRAPYIPLLSGAIIRVRTVSKINRQSHKKLKINKATSSRSPTGVNRPRRIRIWQPKESFIGFLIPPRADTPTGGVGALASALKSADSTACWMRSSTQLISITFRLWR